MAKDVVKRLQVTFAVSLPMGTRGTFTHDGEMWVAYPASKNQRIFTVIDRMIGIFGGIHDDMLRWINHWPEDGERVCAVIESVDKARALRAELVTEKMEAGIS